MAAELKLVLPQCKVTLVQSRDKLLSAEPLPDETKDRTLELLREANVEVLLSHRLDTKEEVEAEDGSKCYKLTFTNGHSVLASEVIMAISNSIPSTTFLPKEALNEEGLVKIINTYVLYSFRFLFFYFYFLFMVFYHTPFPPRSK